MAYVDEYKADEQIFEQIVPIDVGSIVLAVPNPNIIEKEAISYYANSSGEEVKRRLPGAHVTTLDEARKQINNGIDRILFRQGFLYGIRPRNIGLPIGYIMVNSPISSTGLNDWSIDFWMGHPFLGKRVMKVCLNNLLVYLQKMAVPVVKAVVEADNIRSIKILKGLNFSFQETIYGDDVNSERKVMDLYSRHLNGKY